MLKLKNVSKFYYNKGVIASGFTKVSIAFDIGEFVVITGESGSGKSTLLHVISGLDSYEEGEMYINGEETSHYGENDFEEYRKKYVSNIFQNFNLVNSYTVYQNVELVLLINGYKRSDVRGKVNELIEKVKLTKYRNTKVSKLSGGQKQRVAIARALAKETPIIVCDEPTANLDSKSSKEIIRILKEISKDKLVIMVTHDEPSVAEVATRIVRMHDGKIVSDKKKVDADKVDGKVQVENLANKKMGLFNIIRLGVRNTFNILPKFVLLFFVFLFITTSIMTIYGSLRESEYESSKMGENYYFSDLRDTRIILKKKDGTPISAEEFEQIKKLENVESVFLRDLILDEYFWFDSMDDAGFYLSGVMREIDTDTMDLDYGRMPSRDNEVVLLVNPYDFTFNDRVEDAVKATYYLNGNKAGKAIKVVGVKYMDDEDMLISSENIIYANKNLMDQFMLLTNMEHSQISVNINHKNYESYANAGSDFYITVSDKVGRGKAIVSENINYACKDYTCRDKDLKVQVSNLYYQDGMNLKISQVYNSKNVESLVGINKDSPTYGAIFMNPEDYNQLFNKDSYQASVFAKRVDYVDSVSQELDKMGYETMQMRKILNNAGEEIRMVLRIVKLVVIVFLVITLFFISYFVIQLILKSRNIYFSTLRILGATGGQIKKILDLELFVHSNLAYFIYILFVFLVHADILKIGFIKSATEYLHLTDYLLLYVILIAMSYLLSSRFAAKIFKKSAMKSYREEV